MIFVIADKNTLYNTEFQGDELPDALNCFVTEQKNGEFSFEMQYPLSGLNADKLIVNAIVMVSPRPEAQREPFRICSIEQNINRIMTVRGNHIVYDTDGYIVMGFQPTGITTAISWANQNILGSLHCEIVNDGVTDETTRMQFVKPTTAWNIIGGFSTYFGAELSYHFNTFTKKTVITTHASRGSEKRTIIQYGVNIVDLQRKQSVENMYSRVKCNWKNSVGSYRSTGVTSIDRTLLLDISNEFDTEPTPEQMQEYLRLYIQNHEFGITDDLSVQYIPIGNTTEYESTPVAIVGIAIVGTAVIGQVSNLEGSERLDLCDTATIDASLIGVERKAQCVEVVFNALKNRYDHITIGAILQNIIDQIVRNSEAV